MDFFRRAIARPFAIASSIFRTFNALVKTDGWFKRAGGSTLLVLGGAFLYTLIDFFQSRKL
jgi:hypothetical protein